MLKFLLLELVKAYLTNTIPPPKEEKRYSNYFIVTFVIVALLLLMLADYIYIYDEFRYVPYLKSLLITSTTLLLVAVVIKLSSLYLNQKKHHEELLGIKDLPSVITEIVPVVVSMIPVAVVGYILWAKIQVKFPGKAKRLKSTIKRLF